MGKIFSFTVGCMVAVSLAGCGGGGETEMSNKLPTDATDMSMGLGKFTQTGCQQNSDCPSVGVCDMNKCDPSTKMCITSPKPCDLPTTADAQCNIAGCDPMSGACGATPTNEGTSCTSMSGTLGTCMSGVCNGLPTCYDPTNGAGNTTFCGAGVVQDSNTSEAFDTTMATNNYPCAMNETAPEVAYAFSVANDEDVSFTLSPGADDNGVVTDSDLDLIVLEGSCTESATCANPMLAGGGYQGVTLGTANEHVSFHATAGTAYYIVVDGKNGATGFFNLSVDSCGACQATPATTLACNQSMPLAGNTASGKSAIGSYSCTSASGTTQTVTAAGNEQAFLFVDAAPSPRNVTAALSGATANVDLMVLPVGDDTSANPGACNPTMCVGSATSSAAGNAKVSWLSNGTPAYSSPTEYFVVVDSPTMSTDATFGLELTCPAYCAWASDSVDLSCTNTNVGPGQRNDQSGSTNINTQYGPASAPCGGLTNQAGPEYVYLLQTPAVVPKLYTLILSTITAGKTLTLNVLDAGTTEPNNCDPTTTCATASSGAVYTAKAGGTNATVKIKPATSGEHYYWLIVDGVTASDAAEFTLEISSGCQ